MYERIRENNGKKPLRIVELKTITKKELEEFKKHLTTLQRGGLSPFFLNFFFYKIFTHVSKSLSLNI